MWACGVMLYVMLAAAYPFGRPEDEQIKPSARMHAMLQVVHCHPAPTLSDCDLEAGHLALIPVPCAFCISTLVHVIFCSKAYLPASVCSAWYLDIEQ